MHQDPLDTCPYDPIHQIFRSRMPYHLLRCSQNFPCSKKKQCPFDARHLINPIEFNYHINTCASRESVWQYKLINKNKMDNNILPIDTEPIAVSNENWDDDPEVQSYNPEKNIQNRAIVRSSIGLSKAKRRQFRIDERRRIQAIDANNERQEKKVTKVEEPDDEYKPLRRPKKLQSEMLNSSAISLNSSIPSAGVSSIAQLRRPKKLSMDISKTSEQSFNAPNIAVQPKPENESAFSTSLKSVQKDDTPAPNTVPFSYSAALSRKIPNKIVEEEQFDDGKDNISISDNTSNSSFFSFNANDSLIDKLSKTMEELAEDDEGYKKKTEPLNQEIEKLKNLKLNNATNSDKKHRKCAAYFAELK